MLWYDASFLPSDMPFTEKKSYGNSGFVFNSDLFKNDFVPENAYNLEDCTYLTNEDIPNVSDTAEPVSKKDYSAYVYYPRKFLLRLTKQIRICSVKL